MSVLSKEIPQDWYRPAFDGATADMAWTERTESEVDRALKMLRPEGGERILDLACGSGRHSLELTRCGFAEEGFSFSVLGFPGALAGSAFTNIERQQNASAQAGDIAGFLQLRPYRPPSSLADPAEPQPAGLYGFVFGAEPRYSSRKFR